MDDLIAFLNARLDEDEATASVAVRGGASRWQAEPEGYHEGRIYDAAGEVVVYDEGSPTHAQALHIARHDPARVLREVAAKRAILARHKPLHGTYGPCCAWCSDDVDAVRLNKPWPCEDVRDLGTVWSNHPDYSDGWKP